MEPVTHLLTGACLARSGANRRAAYATAAMTIGAYFPDIDTVTSFAGPVTSFQHHRGITHTLLGVPFEAAFLTAHFYAWHRFRLHRQRRQAPAASTETRRALTAAPVHWPRLYGFVLLALLSHLFLDFTNNYGLRPFFPFDPRWHAASIVFILDPLLLLLLLLPFVLPPLFRLIGAEVGVRRQPFPSRLPSVFALLCVVSLWTTREIAHIRAQQIAMGQSLTLASTTDVTAAGSTALQPERVLANPDPFNPFRWHIVTDFGSFYQLGEVNLLTGTLRPGQDLFPKPSQTPAVLAAQASQLGRAYMDWSPMPILTESPPGDPGRGPTGHPGSDSRTIVTFRDPRFMLDLPFFRSRSQPPLTGTVELDAQNRVVLQTMDGSVQR